VKNRWYINTGDCLIEVTTWASLTLIKFTCKDLLAINFFYYCLILLNSILFSFPIFWLTVPDDGYSRNTWCALTILNIYVLLSIKRYFLFLIKLSYRIPSCDYFWNYIWYNIHKNSKIGLMGFIPWRSCN
jgi:hypothetical protein